jgi:hypothetical protein
MCKFIRLTNFKLEAIFELKPVATTRQMANLDRSKANPFTLGSNLTALAIWIYTGLTRFQHLPIHKLILFYMVQISEDMFAVGSIWSSQKLLYRESE